MRFISLAVLALASFVAASPSALTERAKEKEQPPAGCAQLPSGTIKLDAAGGQVRFDRVANDRAALKRPALGTGRDCGEDDGDETGGAENTHGATMRFISLAVLALASFVAASPSALSERAKEKEQPPAGCAQLPSGTIVC
ncbi:hypothetical protein AURDEDRAFT_168265 [Auricularia subglabra TFB-10046 SS5]|nr:hypothetical protein AURDEDRAFT_168265 [Auricularia subglabra TFB-10046 SS5]